MIKKATNVQYGYTIEGNTIQDGVPSPQNLVIPNGTGDRTGNLWSNRGFSATSINLNYTHNISNNYGTTLSTTEGDEVTITQSAYPTGTLGYQNGFFMIDVDFSKYDVGDVVTISFDYIVNEIHALSTQTATTVYAGKDSNTVPAALSSGDWKISGRLTATITIIADMRPYVEVRLCGNSITVKNIMLNEGNTPLPYEPYGYKIPITSVGENLFDKNAEGVTSGKYVNGDGEEISSPNWKISDYIEITGNAVTISGVGGNAPAICAYDENKDYVRGTVYLSGSAQNLTTVTIATIGCKYVRFSYQSFMNPMLNLGPTALPYKPYIEPINTNIYLGQVETTRNIKKLVLTGEETSWYTSKGFMYSDTIQPDYLRSTATTLICSHYKAIGGVGEGAQVSNGQCALCRFTGVQRLYIRDNNYTTVADFKTYLQQQYAAGTPVTVWYVLSEPETAVVNEPLMKIGNYVDTINNTQSGIDISTNNLVVNTIIPPSKIDITSTATWVPINYNKNGTEIISTIAPIDFLSNGQNITVGLKGNTEQLEIPSPSNIVMPQGTGERTGNLCTGYTTPNSQFNIYIENLKAIVDTVRSFTLSFDSEITYAGNTLYLITDGGNIVIGYVAGTGHVVKSFSFNSTQVEAIKSSTNPYIRLYVNGADMSGNTNVMLNSGSTALPYQPYGYKLDIKSANTTTPIYLGEVQTTRKIKKLVLTGKEGGAWSPNPTIRNGNGFYNLSIFTGYKSNSGAGYCSHYPLATATTVTIGVFFGGNINFITDFSEGIDTADKWKSYLQQQYAAGTPVTVWYVLATPETGIINEPLMKIGNYADEVSNITIPTTKGSNTLSITTSVQPSNVQLSISGWVPHNNVKEYKNNAWMATSWEGFRDIVRAGNGPTRYPIGTKLYETWGDDTSNAWIIVDYDNSNYNDPDISALGYTHNVVLYEEKINYLRVFDNAEAWLYTESVLPAGTYRFTIPNYDATCGGNKTYIFTSTVDVPIHGQLTLSWPYQKNPVSVSAYTTNTSTTALFTATVTEWDGTTISEDLGTIKLAMTDSDSTYGKLNHIHRARYGSNNYYQSGIRQWMNADATANNWWKPTNIFDRPYSNRTTDGGLYLMDKDFRKVIAAPNITCITNNIFETGTSGSTAFKLQTQYTIRDKIFLPTHTELNLSSSPNIGTIFSQYTNTGNDDRIKYRKDNGNAYYYWFRTSYPSHGSNVRYVGSSGALNNSTAYDTTGAVRACIIQ